jgi:mannan endo-1,4-beta-mannosidase
MPWQFGALGLTEDGGNRLIKYSDQILNGASPNDGLAIYKNNTAVWDIFTRAAQVQDSRSG